MESSTFPMAIFFEDTMRTASLMEKVNIFGKMEPIIKATLSKAFVKAKDSGRVRLEIYTTGISVETEKSVFFYSGLFFSAIVAIIGLLG